MTWRKYPINEKFFNCIDLEEKAYFLGLLYADGTNSTAKTEVSLRLQENDRMILCKLNELLQPTKPIMPIIRKNQKKQYRLLINSKIISYRLNELGVIPNKTFNLKYPQWIDDKLCNHFIRGYFDGDGYVGYNSANKMGQFSFTGTEDMLLNIQNQLIKFCGLNTVKMYIRYPERNNNIRMLMYSGNGNLRKFYNFLYYGANYYTERKKK